MELLGIGWQPSTVSGWGIFGVNFAYEAFKAGRAMPCFLVQPSRSINDLADEQRQVLATIHAATGQVLTNIRGHSETAKVSFPIIAAANHDFVSLTPRSTTANHAVTFQEHNILSDEGRVRARSFDTIVAGSTWVGDWLRAEGLDNVRVILQGIDHARFRPRPEMSNEPGPFRVFSGGKLEYRKGQDIVIAAFRAFHARHPDAKLCFCWDNLYPRWSALIEHGGLVTRPPEINSNTKDEIARWLVDNGLPSGSFDNIGMVANKEMPQILQGMDAAVFPNRCEGGTNLVAMEAMACGVPTILSANTGHLDLIGDDNCYVLTDKGSVPWCPSQGNVEHWGESSVDQIVEALDAIYSDRDEARRRAGRGAATLAELSWQRQSALLLDAIGF
ncbi:MAG: glycosyltransferase family 4 protein [Alphaproteobacteria bacterium]|nr:glycosyltransferase family 4 protein [Alphaproteobacteria bacterium]